MKIIVYRDNTPTLQVQAFHSDNSVVSLGGCSILMCFKMDQSLPNSEASITKSTSAGTITIVDSLNGIFNTKLTIADTQGFTETTFLYMDILITDSSGQVFTIGNVTTIEIKANYSRR
jgi:hypothetical protein